MGSRAEGARLGEPGLINFMGVQLLVPAQGCRINFSTMVYLQSHQLNAMLDWGLKPHEKGNMAV